MAEICSEGCSPKQCAEKAIPNSKWKYIMHSHGKNGYKGLLTGDSVVVPKEAMARGENLLKHGGSPIGNSRVKLTNLKDCLKRNLIKDGEVPLEVAAKQLQKDGSKKEKGLVVGRPSCGSRRLG